MATEERLASQQGMSVEQATAHRKASLRLLLMVLYIILFLVIFGPEADHLSILFSILVLTALTLWFGPLALITDGDKRKIYDPATLFNLAIFYYGLKGLPISWGDRHVFMLVLDLETTIERLNEAAIYTILGVLAFNTAYHIALYYRSAADRRSEQAGGAVPPAGALARPERGVALLTLVGLGSFLLLFGSIGRNIFQLLLTPQARAYLSEATYGFGSSLGFFFLYGIYMLPIGSLFWLAALGGRGKRPNLWWWGHAALSLGALFLVSPRSNILAFLVSALLVYHLTIRPVRFSWLGLAGLAGFVFAYGTRIWRRVVGTMAQPTIEAAINELGRQLSVSGLFEFFGGTDLVDIRMFVLIVDAYGRDLPLKYGETLTRLVTQLIPRAIWPGKPYDLGNEIGQLFGANYLTGAPPGFFGEMYMNWHILGPILGGIGLGAGMAWLYHRWMVKKPGAQGLLFYAIVAPRVFLLPSSTFANVVLTVAILLAGAYGAFFMSRQPGPPRQQTVNQET